MKMIIGGVRTNYGVVETPPCFHISVPKGERWRLNQVRGAADGNGGITFYALFNLYINTENRIAFLAGIRGATIILNEIVEEGTEIMATTQSLNVLSISNAIALEYEKL